MKRELNIAVFGLSFSWLDQIKDQILKSIPSDVSVSFVNLAEKNIDVLFVNDAFFNSSSIQKILAGRVSKYLRLVKSPEHTGEIIDDTLFYPFNKQEHLTHWIEENLLGNKSTVKPFPVDMGAIEPPATTSAELIKELFTPRNGFIQLRDEQGFIALIDTRTERVWLNHKEKLVQLRDGIRYTYATNHLVQEVSKTRSAQDLRVWLWSTMQYQNPPGAHIKLNQYFKMDVWPQFDRSFERRESLKMAACLAQGAKLEDVQKSLNITPEKLQSFVVKLELLGMGRFITSAEAKFVIAENNVEEQGALKGFFGKLRKKLGL